MSFFHSLKKAVSRKPTEPVETDREWSDAFEKFELLSATTATLHAQAERYKAAFTAMLSHAHAISQEFAQALSDPHQPPHPFTQMAQDLGRTHAATLNANKTQVLLHAIVELLEKPLSEQVEANRKIKARLTERQKLQEEYVYYKSKVDGLKRGPKPDDIVKYDRNVQKCDEASNMFQVASRSLIVDMTTAWTNRVLVLGPAMAGFVGVENQLTQFYSHAIRGIAEVDVVEATKALKGTIGVEGGSSSSPHGSTTAAYAPASNDSDPPPPGYSAEPVNPYLADVIKDQSTKQSYQPPPPPPANPVHVNGNCQSSYTPPPPNPGLDDVFSTLSTHEGMPAGKQL